MFCTALVIVDSIPRDPDEGEEGETPTELWSGTSLESNKMKKSQAQCIFNTVLSSTNHNELDSVTKIFVFPKLYAFDNLSESSVQLGLISYLLMIPGVSLSVVAGCAPSEDAELAL